MSRLNPKTVMLLGVPFHDVTMEETLDEIDAIIAERTPRYLATANLDFAAQASRDVELQRILLDAHLVLCDGMPLIWASRWLQAPLRERVAGSDLTPRLAARAAAKGHRLFFLGSDEAVLLRAKTCLEAAHPGLAVCGVYSPPHARLLELNHDEIADRIRAARPDVVLVALGAPKQEKWIYMHYQTLGVPLCIGIGASFDLVAGKFSRAPVWMQKTGLEWAHRLCQEPRRLFLRYCGDLLFFGRALRWQRRLLAAPAAPAVSVPAPARCADVAVLVWKGRADAAAMAGGLFPLPEAQPGCARVALDLSGVTFIDSTGLGAILKGFRRCREAGGGLVLLHPSPAVRALLRASKLERILPLADGLEEARAVLDPARATEREASPRDGHVIIRCLGELNAATAPTLRERLRAEWTGDAAARVLELDFTSVNFIDSSGLGCLLGARKLVGERAGARLQLTGVNDNLRNVIALAHLDGVLGLAQAS